MLSFKSLLMTIECKILYVRLMRKKQINLVKQDIIMSSRALASQRNKRSTGSYNQQPAAETNTSKNVSKQLTIPEAFAKLNGRISVLENEIAYLKSGVNTPIVNTENHSGSLNVPLSLLDSHPLIKNLTQRVLSLETRDLNTPITNNKDVLFDNEEFRTIRENMKQFNEIQDSFKQVESKMETVQQCSDSLQLSLLNIQCNINNIELNNSKADGTVKSFHDNVSKLKDNLIDLQQFSLQINQQNLQLLHILQKNNLVDQIPSISISDEEYISNLSTEQNECVNDNEVPTDNIQDDSIEPTNGMDDVEAPRENILLEETITDNGEAHTGEEELTTKDGNEDTSTFMDHVSCIVNNLDEHDKVVSEIQMEVSQRIEDIQKDLSFNSVRFENDEDITLEHK